MANYIIPGSYCHIYFEKPSNPMFTKYKCYYKKEKDNHGKFINYYANYQKTIKKADFVKSD